MQEEGDPPVGGGDEGDPPVGGGDRTTPIGDTTTGRTPGTGDSTGTGDEGDPPVGGGDINPQQP